ncbi:TPA: DUF1642 domain-containing protein [Streptococcus agalactiae]|uniref:DUF1642 domain-containing protein n=1 Tax=Streptococcus agalactiae TaxID=1311 RepID=UPI000EAC934F|nr:DUF1642 domain-containing protein [Streptococcus agalactiae]MCC9928053.1 DUF1642 domain-containing protein [Streptococcus agalactiae]RKX13054.1 DUF1642 domain-containing protein [Streptococcus agalactiae]HEN6106128.1 DUF1642 domain-containing protein [Streptococcus agalactiae]HEN6763238.1 DUF1642 domain-containing protein [Streptococcus agalactiae]HEN6857774.1 DUF1642 domain-containing protein [Streptococcus agalactiae]
MNIEEAKKIVDKLSVDSDELWKIPMIPAHKVKALLDTLDQPKPEVPQCVAEWLEGLKKEFPDNLPNQLYHVTRQGWGYGFEYEDSYTEEMKTLYNCGGKIKKDLVNALLYGYTVEKEKLYKVRDKRLSPNRNYLNFDEDSECWFFSNGNTALSLKAEHPRKALEESGFNVFDDDNYEVIEVTE